MPLPLMVGALGLGLARLGGQQLAARERAKKQSEADALLQREIERRARALGAARGATEETVNPITGEPMSPEMIGGADPLASPGAMARAGYALAADPAFDQMSGDMVNQLGQYYQQVAGDEAGMARQTAADEAAMGRLKISDATDRALLQRQIADAENAGGGFGAAFGSIPAGHQRTITPGGRVVDLPNQGTEAYARLSDGVRSTSEALMAIEALRDSIGQSGTELFGAESKRQKTLYTNVLKRIGDLNNAGVLQAGEMEFYKEAVPDPSSWGATLTGTGSIASALDTLKEMIMQRGVGIWAKTPEGVMGEPVPEGWDQALRDDPNALPPGFSEVGGDDAPIGRNRASGTIQRGQ